MNYPNELNEVPIFSEWLQALVQGGNQAFENDIIDLSMPPNSKARSFKSMKAYGNYIRVSSVEEKLVTSDSAVTATCETMQRSGPSDRNLVAGYVTYFGRVGEIIELDYGRLKPVVLLCDWVEPIWRGPTACLKKDTYNYTFLKLKRLMHRSANSFVFPVQVSKIFYCTFPEDTEWSTVLHAPSRVTRVSQDSGTDGTAIHIDLNVDVLSDDMQELVDVDDVQHDGDFDEVGYNISEEELRVAEIIVECEARQFEEEGSDDDTLLEFGGEEDEAVD